MAQHGTKEETLLKPPREELAEGWLGEKGKRLLKSNGEDRRERQGEILGSQDVGM